MFVYAYIQKFLLDLDSTDEFFMALTIRAKCGGGPQEATFKKLLIV